MAFEEFYRTTAQPLQNFLFLYVGDRQAAEDISQETFMQLWQRPNGFDPAKSKLKTYLFGVARHRVTDWWRQKPMHQEEVVLNSAKAQGETRTMLENALAQLDPDVRSLIWLREAEGYSYHELADILNIPLGTVGSRLSTAREKLRRIWKSKPESV